VLSAASATCWRDVVASTDSGDQPPGDVQDGLQSSVDAVAKNSNGDDVTAIYM